MLKRILFFLIICVIANNSIAQQKNNYTQASFVIDGNKVTQKKFEDFLATLTEIPNTFLIKNNHITTYNAKDKNGNVYTFTSAAKTGSTKCIIQKIQTVNIRNETYEINDKMVTKEEFERFSASLTQIQSTFLCGQMVNGASISYDAKDKNGVLYEYSNYSDDKSCKMSIRKKSH